MSRSTLLVVLAALAAVLLAPPATASERLTLTPGQLRGWETSRLGVVTVRAELAAGATKSQRRGIARTPGQALRARRGNQAIVSGALVPRRASAAKRTVRRWVRSRRAARVKGLGEAAWLERRNRGRTTRFTVAWRSRGRIGLLRFSVRRPLHGARALAVGYARLADAALRARRPATAWGRALRDVRPNGMRSKADALRLFSVAYGRLPGVEMPAGRRTRIPSGTLAARWALRYRSQLTRKQRRVVDRRLGVRVGRSAARGAAAGDYGDSQFEPDPILQELANEFNAIFASVLGRLSMRIVAGETDVYVTSPRGLALADATPMTGSRSASGSRCGSTGRRSSSVVARRAR